MTTNHWKEPGKVEQLLSLWSAGTSGGRIAQIMGLTRSSVMGKLHKLGALNSGRQPTDRIPPHKFKPGQSKPFPKSWSDKALTETWADRKKRRAHEQRHQR